MIRERKALPAGVGPLFDTAFAAFGRRIALYATVALAGFVVQALAAAVVAALAGGRSDVVAIAIALAGILVDAFIMGVVTIGIASDVAGDGELTARAIVDAALRRLLPLVAVSAIANVTVLATAGGVLAPDVWTFALLVLPMATLWGVLDFMTVVCATEPFTSGVLLIATSVGKSFRLALAAPNFGRTVLLGLATLPPLLLETVLFDQLQLRHVRGFAFWANVPIDAIVVGPIQAVFTVFYFDFVRRAAAAGR